MAECPGTYITTYRGDYKNVQQNRKTEPATKIPQEDEPLISQHFRNTLQVKGMQVKSKVWPKANINLEEYKDYLKRLKCCKKDFYERYFECPCTRIGFIEHMLRDLGKSEYQVTYSPKVFESRKNACSMGKMAPTDMKVKFYPTTYGAAYNRDEFMERYRGVANGTVCKYDTEQHRNDMRQINKEGSTIYHIEICEPAILSSKLRPQPLLESPIDQYTLRKVCFLKNCG